MPEILLTLAVLTVVVAIARQFLGFGAQRSADYAATSPQIDIRQHLQGPLLCEGVVYGPTGRVTSRFVANMHGRWDGNRGILDEHFQYSSGEAQSRQWHLSLGNDGMIQAEADDLVRPGNGRQEGATVCLTYRIRLPAHAGGWVLDVTDWMYLCDNGTVVNRSQFRKFGIKVAELVATMRKVPA